MVVGRRMSANGKRSLGDSGQSAQALCCLFVLTAHRHAVIIWAEIPAMTPHEAEALEFELFIGAGRPLLGLTVVCIKALPRLLLASAVLTGCIYGRSAVPAFSPLTSSNHVQTPPRHPHGGNCALLRSDLPPRVRTPKLGRRAVA